MSHVPAVSAKVMSDANEPQPARAPRSAMFMVFVVVVIDLLGFGMVLPLLPLTGDEYIKPLLPDEQLHGPILGLLMASFSAMQFLFAPVWGRISDRIGRRRILLIGLLGSVAFYSLFGYAAGLSTNLAALALTLLFLARIGAGIAGATIATAQAVIADCTSQEGRKKGMALIGAAFGIAFTLGPLLGAAALAVAGNTRDATSWTGYVAASLSLVALLLAVALLPETRQVGAAPTSHRKLLDWTAWRAVLADPALAPVILLFFLATLGFGGFETTLAMLLRDSVRLQRNNSFLVFAYVGFILMLTQGVLYRRLAKRFSESAFILLGLVLMAVGVLLLGGVSLLAYFCSSRYQPLGAIGGAAVSELYRLPHFGAMIALLLVALAAAVIGFAFLTPSAQALVSRRTSADKQGEVLGVNQSVAALARILGPIFGLSLYKLTPTHMLPYVLGAGLLVLMLPLLPRIRRG
jgi:MFS family permease